MMVEQLARWWAALMVAVMAAMLVALTVWMMVSLKVLR
jgi:hypothetical protein